MVLKRKFKKFLMLNKFLNTVTKKIEARVVNLLLSIIEKKFKHKNCN